MATGSVTVRLNLSSAGYSAEMQKAERQMRQLQKAGEDFGHSMPSQMQASSAALRTLEGNLTNNLRAAERFLTLLPGVGAALQVAFPVVGAIALLGVLKEMTERFSGLMTKLNDIPANPFSGMIDSAKMSNDALAITNDRLADEIAKLEKTPQNRMAEALDQMREASDKLFDSLQKSNAAFDEAAKKGQVGTVQGVWRNETPTKVADANIKRARAGVQAVIDDHQPTIDDANASRDPENIRQAREAFMVDLQKAYAVQDKALQDGLNKALAAQKDFHGSYSVGSNPRAVVERYQSALSVSAQDQQRAGGEYGNSLLTGRLDNDRDAGDKAQLAQEAAGKQLQGMGDELLARKAQYGMSIAEERSYWQQRESAFSAGSEQYREVVNKVNELEVQMAHQQQESLKAARRGNDGREDLRVLESASAAVSTMMRREAEDVLHTGERWKAYNESMAKAAEIQAANEAAFDKASLAIEGASGQISKLDAAQRLASIHAKEFADNLAALQKQRAQINSDSSLTGGQKTTALQQNSNAQSVLQGQYKVQQINDQSAISDTQLGPATRDALSRMVQDWTNMTQSIVSIMTKTIDSFNDDIAKAITGHGSKADFGRTFSQAGEGLIKTSLQSVEGHAMSALGLGKPDGSANNPIYTRDADSVAGVGDILGGQSQGNGQQQNGKGGWLQPILGFTHKLFSGQNKGDGGDGGGGGGGGDDDDGPDFDDIFQGGFASGGHFVANRPMLVGEKHAELITPDRSGTVIPLDKLGGGGTTIHHYAIDARGSNDPMAVHAAVARALPHAVAASVQANHDRGRRTPHGR